MHATYPINTIEVRTLSTSREWLQSEAEEPLLKTAECSEFWITWYLCCLSRWQFIGFIHPKSYFENKSVVSDEFQKKISLLKVLFLTFVFSFSISGAICFCVVSHACYSHWFPMRQVSRWFQSKSRVWAQIWNTVIGETMCNLRYVCNWCPEQCVNSAKVSESAMATSQVNDTNDEWSICQADPSPNPV